MFRMSGRLEPAPFRRAAFVRVALFAASIVAFPLLVVAVAWLSGCRSTGGACGALAAVMSMALKPLFFILLVASLVGISIRRSRDAGLPAAFGLFIPLLVAADSTFGIFMLSHWGFAVLASGVWSIKAPLFLLFALACMALLGLLPSRPRRQAIDTPLDFLALPLAGAIAACAILRVGVNTIPLSPDLKIPLMRAQALLSVPSLVVMGAFLVVAALIVRRERRKAGTSDRSLADEPAPEAEPRKRAGEMWGVGLAGALLSLAVLAVGGPDGLLTPLGIFATFISIILPTFALYTFLVWAVWRLATRPFIATAAIAAASFLPFVLWTMARLDVDAEIAAERREVAAIETKPLPHRPHTLVVEHASALSLKQVMEASQARQIIVKGAYRNRLMSYTGEDLERGVRGELSEVFELPGEYLLLRVGRESEFRKPRQIYHINGGPFELRYVAAGHDHLVGIWYEQFNKRPVAPPILTQNGWLYRGNTGTMEERTQAAAEFLRRSLGEPQAAVKEAASVTAD
jgi:hypothetical protein